MKYKLNDKEVSAWQYPLNGRDMTSNEMNESVISLRKAFGQPVVDMYFNIKYQQNLVPQRGSSLFGQTGCFLLDIVPLNFRVQTGMWIVYIPESDQRFFVYTDRDFKLFFSPKKKPELKTQQKNIRYKCQCQDIYCKHTWTSRSNSQPLTCPKCKTKKINMTAFVAT